MTQRTFNILMTTAFVAVMSACALLIGALLGCSHANRYASSECELCGTHRIGPPHVDKQDGTAIPAWNVGGTIYAACGAGGKACAR